MVVASYRREWIDKSYFGKSHGSLTMKKVEVKIPSRDRRHVETIAVRMLQKPYAAETRLAGNNEGCR